MVDGLPPTNPPTKFGAGSYPYRLLLLNRFFHLNINPMKSTKIMLACIATFLLSWLLLSLIVYLLMSDTSFREIAGSTPLVMTMIVIGWIPAMVVGSDLDSKLSK